MGLRFPSVSVSLSRAIVQCGCVRSRTLQVRVHRMALRNVVIGMAISSLLDSGNAFTSVHTPGAQHPDAHIHGFVVKSLFLHDVAGETGELHRRFMQFDDNPHLLDLEAINRQRRLLALPEFGASSAQNSRDRIIALAKLNLLSYDYGADESLTVESFYSDSTMSDIYAQKDSIYGESIENRTAEQAHIRAIHDAIYSEVTTDGASTTSWTYRPEDTQITDGKLVSSGIGVAGIEFVRGDMTVMVFRGTFTDGDYANIYNWKHDWILTKMSGRMKDMWETEAGLTWDDTKKDRSGQSTTFAEGLICAYNALNAGAGKELSDASDVTTEEQAKATGYWEITKAIADELHTAASEGGGSLLFSGHSQGGTRAGLASMYLKKKASTTYDAVTFAATGEQCVARLLHSDATLLDDVDPFVAHPQIREYVHVLDPWGQALGLQVGVQCSYGKTKPTPIADSNAMKYCDKSFGYPGAILWFNEGAGAIAFGDYSLQDKELATAFAQCRYYTHFMEKMLLDLQAPGTLLPSGDTADGCTQVAVADQADAAGLCPDPENTVCEDALAVWIIAVSAAAGAILLLIICICCYCCRKRSKTDAVGNRGDS